MVGSSTSRTAGSVRSLFWTTPVPSLFMAAPTAPWYWDLVEEGIGVLHHPTTNHFGGGGGGRSEKSNNYANVMLILLKMELTLGELTSVSLCDISFSPYIKLPHFPLRNNWCEDYWIIIMISCLSLGSVVHEVTSLHLFISEKLYTTCCIPFSVVCF